MLRILTFNIHGGYDLKGRRDLRRVHALMDTLDVDIGVFQEMETRPSYGGGADDVDLLAGPDRCHHLPGPTLKEGPGWYGNLIVSRHPIVRARVHGLDTTRALEPRNAVDALIETPMGLIRVIGTHLSLSSFVRWGEVRNLMKLTAAVDETAHNPVFFMGDINEWCWPHNLNKHIDGLMTPLPCGRTFPAFFPLLRLDRVWYDKTDGDITAQALTGPQARELSDHLPILVEIRSLRGSAETP